ncbi:glycoside hydrolase family 95 protein [Aplosporella prunicola CBS 121167]|uniref:Glycoside hydrolase family 95 protein n=1 Tax=Aplosporella prunicola CBS 121167 TaxID=1176127 RepID=A0A6A6AXW8_9PEZI|nr:glycoside hydrolase family 95 protein [Aplosporella prunicola CBS 121167]KAF2135825.1 glycoside hydrolase family 95 protein [Aplosporella prunicola CBS 121167]
MILPIFLGLAALSAAAELLSSATPSIGSTTIWYTAPAPEWNLALPIGTGRLGGMVYGGTLSERVQMNEDSIWNGGFQDRLNPRAATSFPTIRGLLRNESLTAAGSAVLRDMTGNPTSPRAYHPMAELFADFGHPEDQLSNYSRWLDTRGGYVGSQYSHNGVQYTRTSFGSFPASVLVLRFEADKEQSVTTNITLFREFNVSFHGANLSLPDSYITLRAGSGQQDGINFTAKARINIAGQQANLSTNGTSVEIRNADAITIFVDAETSYRYSTEEEWEAELDRKLTATADVPFETIKKDALDDFTSLSDRTSLDFGSSGDVGKLPTLDRLHRYRNVTMNGDPELATLLFNLGRYMLITSSRSEDGITNLPANLQGVWSPSYNPPWGGKYTTNINVEMNYWPAEITNLAETHLPLFDLIEITRSHGRDVAKRMYNCSGFMIHHNTDVWGDGVPTENGTQWSMWPMGASWLSLHLMEHYRFNGDKEWLESTALPILNEVAEFYYCYLFDYKGYYSTGPSISPENSFKLMPNQSEYPNTESIDIAPTMDNELLFELFSAIVEAAQELELSETDPAILKASQYLAKIKRPQISPTLGTIMEWRLDYEEKAPGHRHVSHLFGLHPGRSISMAETPELATAANATLNRRLSNGGAGTGWSRAWTINWFARLWQGDAAWENAQMFLNVSTNDNLFGNNPYPTYQCDGNFGFTAGIAEMLLQSHNSEVHLLPALPSPEVAIANGTVKGLVARGGFVVDIAWEAGRLKDATVVSKLGRPLTLKVGNEATFEVNGTDYADTLQTQEGESFQVTL